MSNDFFLHAVQGILRASASYMLEDRFVTEFQRKYISEKTKSFQCLVVSNHRHSDLKRTEHLIELTGNVYFIIQKYPHRQVVLHSLTNVYHGV